MSKTDIYKSLQIKVKTLCMASSTTGKSEKYAFLGGEPTL